jgi:hypothetical protein
MFVKHKRTDELIEVMRIEDLYDPNLSEIMGRSIAVKKCKIR